jgi:hypothetical protein
LNYIFFSYLCQTRKIKHLHYHQFDYSSNKSRNRFFFVNLFKARRR